MSPDRDTQSAYRCRLDWGRRGACLAVERGDVIVIVDTLRFSTTVATAVQHGGIVYPCAEAEDALAAARRIGGEAAVANPGAPAKGRFSLSPRTCLNLEPGTRIALASLNGAICSRYAQQAPALFVGTLINAAAAAAAVMQELRNADRRVTVIACGERWKTPSEDGELRFALEDYLGAGAILSCLRQEMSPEARVCASAFLAVRDDLEALLLDCDSGRELVDRGLSDDVRHAARLNLYDAVPVMRGGFLQARSVLAA
jgi:2-phosphosulfolactate phosphatase